MSGGQTNALAGSSTALSDDGNVVAVGSSGYDYDNSADTGRVQVFDYSDGNGWVRRGGADDLSGGQADTAAGRSTALSADGNVVCVGQQYGSSQGRVSVYKYIDKANLSDIIDTIITG